MVLGNFQRRGYLLIWIIVGQRPNVLVVGAGWGLGGYIFSRLSFPCNILRIMRILIFNNE